MWLGGTLSKFVNNIQAPLVVPVYKLVEVQEHFFVAAKSSVLSGFKLKRYQILGGGYICFHHKRSEFT